MKKKEVKFIEVGQGKFSFHFFSYHDEPEAKTNLCQVNRATLERHAQRSDSRESYGIIYFSNTPCIERFRNEFSRKDRFAGNDEPER